MDQETIAQMATEPLPKPPSLLEALKASPMAKGIGLAALCFAGGAVIAPLVTPGKQAAPPAGPVFRLETAPSNPPLPLPAPALSARQSLSTVIVEGCQYILFTVGEPTNANFAMSLCHAGACTNWQAHQAFMK